jgi:ParB family chromosome partitioning protein
MPMDEEPVADLDPGSVQESPAAHPHGLITLNPEQIRANPSNPRLFFKQESIERLAVSISRKGVLVPITVYEDPQVDTAGIETTHVLLDGERRWRAAGLVNHAIPALVVGKPEGVENTLTMFNIHMQREEWSEIATAWALESVMAELQTQDVKTLRQATGLSGDRIRNMLIVLSFPRHYQELIAREDNPVPFNFFVELHKGVLNVAQANPGLVAGRNSESLTNIFLERYETGTLGDVVDLRKVGELLKAGQGGGYIGERARDALGTLLDDPNVSVVDAYAAGAAAGAEMRTILRDVTGLPGRIAYLLTMDLAPEQKDQLRQALESMHHQIDDFLAEL